MKILSIFRKDRDSTDAIAFIAPFNAGDNIHECTILLSPSLYQQLDSNNRLIANGRDDIEDIDFRTYREALKAAWEKVFPELEFTDYYD